MESDEELAARRIGHTVGRYRLDRVIGVGGMAAVYAARAADGSVAAVKILHPEMSLRRDVRERFFREGYVANSIQHPGAVRAIEHGEGPDSGVFLALELLRGETLMERFKRHGSLPQAELLDYADQVLDVLAVAHQQGIVHRDLKPDNLFVTHEGQIKILDFGLARLKEAAPTDYRTRTGMALGTLPYMAPEQALGRRDEIDQRVDLFALGATLFRLLSGRKIHESNSEAELLIAMASKPAPPLSSISPGVAPDLGRVIDLSLAFSRDARYPDARTMQADVRAVRAGARPPYATQRFSEREQKTRMEPMATAPVSGPNSTVPLHVYTANAAQGLGATFTGAPAAPLSNALAAPRSGVPAPVPPAPSPAPAEKTRASPVRWLVPLGALAFAGLGLGAFFALGGDGEEPAASEAIAGKAADPAPPGAAATTIALPAPTNAALPASTVARAEAVAPSGVVAAASPRQGAAREAVVAAAAAKPASEPAPAALVPASPAASTAATAAAAPSSSASAAAAPSATAAFAATPPVAAAPEAPAAAAPGTTPDPPAAAPAASESPPVSERPRRRRRGHRD